MKTAVFGESSISVIEAPVPEPKPGWVRIGVTGGGICGSDLHLLHGRFGPSKGIQPGHEITGVIDALGDSALDTGSWVARGANVAVEPVLGCGGCHFCGVGSANLCPDTRLFGFALPGGLAEFVCVPAAQLYPLPVTMSTKVAALAEPMAVCVRGARIGGVGMGDRVAVLGAGSIGLLSILTARAAGADEVLITARYPHQQELARALGASAVFGSAEELLQEVGDQHADVVIETVGGTATTMAEAVGVARTGATIAMLGVFEGDTPLPGFSFFQKELTLRASNCYGREAVNPDFGLATELIARHASVIEPLVTHTFALDQVADAFATADDKSTRSIKVQIHP